MGFAINSVTISGNLTRDPELRSLSSGQSVCSLRIGHNSRRKQGEEWIDVPNYFDVTVWGGQGEWIARNLTKGAGIVFKGRAQWREWTDNNGNKRQTVDFVADDVMPIGKREQSSGGANNGGGSYYDQSPPPSDVPADTQQFQTTPPPSGPGADDDIPF